MVEMKSVAGHQQNAAPEELSEPITEDFMDFEEAPPAKDADRCGERMLWCAVIERAILDAVDVEHTLKNIEDSNRDKIEEYEAAVQAAMKAGKAGEYHRHLSMRHPLSEIHRSAMRAQRDAQKWVIGNSKDFQMVCDLAGLEPDAIRRATMERIKAAKLFVDPRHNSWGENRSAADKRRRASRVKRDYQARQAVP